MTEKLRKEYEALIEKRCHYGHLTHDEEWRISELKHMFEIEERNRQAQLRNSAFTKIQSATGLTYDELIAFCDWIRK